MSMKKIEVAGGTRRHTNTLGLSISSPENQCERRNHGDIS